MTRQTRPSALLYLPVALLFLGFLFFLSGPAAADDPKADLITLLRGADVDGYTFSMNEDDAVTSSSLTGKGLYDVFTLGKGDADVILRYTSIQDKKTLKTSVYKSEVIKKGTAVNLVITDVAANKVVSNKVFPTPGLSCFPAGQFASLNACIERFRCLYGGNLTCNANLSCDPQFAALTCCLTNGQNFSVHMIFPPTSIACLVRAQTVDVGGLSTSP
ncbi:MAG TPA: hypothetical protein VGS07_24810 [Thermoanaerobaculia bacterium]|jgi:hypothetical protein|nr:hypothetical protein [Thermoanaerobaculia bacterium]